MDGKTQTRCCVCNDWFINDPVRPEIVCCRCVRKIGDAAVDAVLALGPSPWRNPEPARTKLYVNGKFVGEVVSAECVSPFASARSEIDGSFQDFKNGIMAALAEPEADAPTIVEKGGIE